MTLVISKHTTGLRPEAKGHAPSQDPPGAGRAVTGTQPSHFSPLFRQANPICIGQSSSQLQELRPPVGNAPPPIATSVGQKAHQLMWVPSQTDRDRLDHKLMGLKIQTAMLMHRAPDWRHGIFRQLDMLLDEENWEPADELPNDASYLTSVRLLIFLKDVKRPGLGLTHDGHVVLSWTADSDHLTIECRPADQVRWMVSHTLSDGTRERAAGHSYASRIPAVIGAYEPSRWLGPQ
jgi:hypothetical protein